MLNNHINNWQEMENGDYICNIYYIKMGQEKGTLFRRINGETVLPYVMTDTLIECIKYANWKIEP